MAGNRSERHSTRRAILPGCAHIRFISIFSWPSRTRVDGGKPEDGADQKDWRENGGQCLRQQVGPRQIKWSTFIYSARRISRFWLWSAFLVSIFLQSPLWLIFFIDCMLSWWFSLARADGLQLTSWKWSSRTSLLSTRSSTLENGLQILCWATVLSHPET